MLTGYIELMGMFFFDIGRFIMIPKPGKIARERFLQA
jgi:hypothetical protein